MGRYIVMAFSNPIAGREAEYNAWYNEYHVPELLMSPCMVAAQRYRVAPIEPPDYPGYQPMPYSYLNLMEIDTDDLGKFKTTFWGDENLSRIRRSSAFDSSKVVCKIFEPIGPRLLAKTVKARVKQGPEK